MSYDFLNIETCNMCQSSREYHSKLGQRLNDSQGLLPSRKKGILSTVYKCRRCGLIFSNPLPIPQSLEKHYGVPPESYWKKEYFTITDDYFKNELRIIEKLIEIKPGSKSLDIGAGIGKEMIVLSRCGFDAYGLEPSSPFYDRAIGTMGVSKDKLINQSIEEASYPDKYFDFISFGAVLEHLKDPNESIRKALSWLNPNGIIHIEVPSSKWLIGEIINLYYKLTLQGFVTNLSPMHTPYHLYEFDLRSFRHNSKINNYSIAHSEFFVCETYLPQPFDFIARKTMKYTNKGMQLSIWLRKSS